MRKRLFTLLMTLVLIVTCVTPITASAARISSGSSSSGGGSLLRSSDAVHQDVGVVLAADDIQTLGIGLVDHAGGVVEDLLLYGFHTVESGGIQNAAGLGQRALNVKAHNAKGGGAFLDGGVCALVGIPQDDVLTGEGLAVELAIHIGIMFLGKIK